MASTCKHKNQIHNLGFSVDQDNGLADVISRWAKLIIQM